MLEEQNWYPLQSSKLQVTYLFTETCSLAAWCSTILSFQPGMDATLLISMCVCVGGGGGGVTAPPVVCKCRLQWSVSPVAFQCGAVSTNFFQWCSSVPCCIRWVAQLHPSVPWVNQWHSSGIPVYTGPARVHWLRVKVTLPCQYCSQAQVKALNADDLR